MPNTHTKAPLRTGFLRSFVRWPAIGVVLVWSLAALILLAARWIDPPSTAVHIQRHLQAWFHHTPYHERYKFIPLSQISPDLQHAIIARGGRALLPAPWVRLARDPNRCWRRFGRRSHSRSFNHYAATCKEPIFRNGPLSPPQGSGVHTGTGGRIRPRQAAHSRDLPQRGRMGAWYLWCRVGVSLLRRNRGQECRPGTGGAARRDSAGSSEATARAHE